MLTMPAQLPAARETVLICTLTAAGVALLCGDTTSQLFPQDVVAGVAVNAIVPPPVLVTFSVCAAGVEVPIWNANASCAGETLTDAGGATDTCTGIIRPVAPGALMATAP